MSASSKYAGLIHIAYMEKEGVSGKDLALGAADLGSYFIPGVGTVRSGWDAAKNFGSGISNIFRGNFRKGFGNMLSGLGNTAIAGASLVPGGAFIGGAAKLLGKGRLASQLAAGAIKGRRNIQAARKASKGIARSKGLAGRSVRNMGSRVSDGTLGRMEAAGDTMRAMGAPFRGWKPLVAGAGAGVAGGVLEGQPLSINPAHVMQMPIPKYQGLQHMTGQVPLHQRF